MTDELTGEQADEPRDWDIVSGVGITALAVAAARAAETSREDHIVRDPFAAAFVEAANAPMTMYTRFGEIPAGDKNWVQMCHIVAARTKFFDDYFAAATGTRQAVILAAGLDCRAFRLDWPSGTTVFEVDQPRVLEFKDGVLTGLGARASCARRTVPVDLRDDWAAVLREAGFDPALSTAWLVEGLLPYLPDEAATRLLDTIHRLSQPGSTVGIEHYEGAQAFVNDPEFTKQAEDFGLDLRTLFGGGPRKSPDEYLSALGWRMTVETGFEMSARYARPLAGLTPESFGDRGRYITGTLGM